MGDHSTVPIPQGTVDPSIGQPVYVHLADVGREVLHLCQLDHLTLAGALPIPEGHHHSEGAVNTACRVAVEDVGLKIEAKIGVATEAGVSRDTINVAAESSICPVGSLQTKPRHSHHDESGVDLPGPVIGDTEFIGSGRHVVLNQHVGYVEKSLEDLLASGSARLTVMLFLLRAWTLKEGVLFQGMGPGSHSG